MDSWMLDGPTPRLVSRRCIPRASLLCRLCLAPADRCGRCSLRTQALAHTVILCRGDWWCAGAGSQQLGHRADAASAAASGGDGSFNDTAPASLRADDDDLAALCVPTWHWHRTAGAQPLASLWRGGGGGAAAGAAARSSSPSVPGSGRARMLTRVRACLRLPRCAIPMPLRRQVRAGREPGAGEGDGRGCAGGAGRLGGRGRSLPLAPGPPAGAGPRCGRRRAHGWCRRQPPPTGPRRPGRNQCGLLKSTYCYCG
jgi:hypothetical protein